MPTVRPSLALVGLAILGVSLPLLPLVGLLAGALDPPPSPLGALAGADGLAAALLQSEAPRLLARTLLLALVVSAAALPLGTWLGWVEQRARYPGARLLGVLGLLPLAIPSYVLAGTLRQALGPGGAIGGPLGLGPFTGFWPAALVLTLITLPYVQLLTGASLARIPRDEEEAARTLGADPWRAFRVAVLPRLRAALAFSALLVALYTVSDFGAVAVLDCQVLTWRLYGAVSHARFAEAVVLGAAVLVATFPLLAAARLVHGRQAQRTSVANPRRAERRPLPAGALAGTYALHALVVGLGVLVPLLTLAGWVQGGIARGEPFAPVWPPLRDTAALALVGAALTVLLAGGPAWVAARAGPRLSWAVEQATYLSSALPGVLLAFGLLLLALAASRLGEPPGRIYAALAGSGGLLLMGYATRFLAQGFAGLKTAVLHLDPRQEESARVLGASALRRLARVTLPPLAPGTAVALVLIALAIMKELPVTLVLGGGMGVRTLSVRMYDRYQEAFLHDAGLAGLVLVALALAAVTVSLRWRTHA